jgi:hypothetical protein
MIITESSITLDFPDNNCFRFEKCKGYKDIQNNFKEMDVCWYEQITDTLYIIELKDWKDGKLMEENDPNISAQQIKEMKEGISKFQINTQRVYVFVCVIRKTLCFQYSSMFTISNI